VPILPWDKGVGQMEFVIPKHKHVTVPMDLKAPFVMFRITPNNATIIQNVMTTMLVLMILVPLNLLVFIPLMFAMIMMLVLLMLAVLLVDVFSQIKVPDVTMLTDVPTISVIPPAEHVTTLMLAVLS